MKHILESILKITKCWVYKTFLYLFHKTFHYKLYIHYKYVYYKYIIYGNILYNHFHYLFNILLLLPVFHNKYIIIITFYNTLFQSINWCAMVVWQQPKNWSKLTFSSNLVYVALTLSSIHQLWANFFHPYLTDRRWY